MTMLLSCFSEKRALWSWQRSRASIASRWCWLQAQVQELEYRIRQHNELHKQVSKEIILDVSIVWLYCPL